MHIFFVFTNFFFYSSFSFFQHWTQPIYKSRSKSSNFCQHYVFIQPKVIVEHWRHLNITKLFDQKDIDSNWSWMNWGMPNLLNTKLFYWLSSIVWLYLHHNWRYVLSIVQVFFISKIILSKSWPKKIHFLSNKQNR